MSKELPYFKFIATEWLSGDIVLESLELQGMFINICALYWKAGGRLPKAKLDARFRPHEYQPLVDRGLMKIKKNISISFLDDQFKVLSQTRQRQIEGGRKGGLRSAKGKLKVSSSILDKDKDKDKDIYNTVRGESSDSPLPTDSEVGTDKSGLNGSGVGDTEQPDGKPPITFENRYQEFIKHFNYLKKRETGTKGQFKGEEKSKRQFKVIRGKYSNEEIVVAIKAMFNDQHHIDNGFKYATPELITRPEKFEMFLQRV